MVKHYYKNIQNIIQGELFAANQSIKIAVAWFTNDLLFQPLMLKLMTGVKVDIILNKDEINLSKTNKVDFDLFVQKGGNLYWNNTKKLLHHKFCIIDDNTVISGSYNWTNKAESNYESISVFIDDPNSLEAHKQIFNQLLQQFALSKVISNHKCNIMISDKCTTINGSYPSLKFYKSIQLYSSKNTPLLAKKNANSPYALLDQQTFSPCTDYIFHEIGSFLPMSNFLWVKGETQWGLFNCSTMQYEIKPIFDAVEDRTVKDKSPIPFFLLSKNKKFGACIIGLGGIMVIDCEYNQIIFDYKLGFPLFEMHRDSGCYFYIFNKRLTIGGVCCKKWVYKQPSKYSVIEMQDDNGKYRLYVLDDGVELNDGYDTISYFDKYILLIKNGYYGAYVIGDKKIGCNYEYITYLKPFGEGLLYMQEDTTTYYKYQDSFLQRCFGGNLIIHTKDYTPPVYHAYISLEDLSIFDLGTSNITGWPGYLPSSTRLLRRGDIVVFPETIEQVELKKIQIRPGLQDILIKVFRNTQCEWLGLGSLMCCDYQNAPIHPVSASLVSCENDKTRILSMLGKIIRAADEPIHIKSKSYNGNIVNKEAISWIFENITPNINVTAYVLDTRIFLGGLGCVEINFDKAKFLQNTNQPKEYVAGIIRYDDDKYEVYISSAGKILNGRYCKVRVADNIIYLDNQIYSVRYDKYGDNIDDVNPYPRGKYMILNRQ